METDILGWKSCAKILGKRVWITEIGCEGVEMGVNEVLGFGEFFSGCGGEWL